MSYGFNLNKISLVNLKELVKTTYLIPSMRMLVEDIDDVVSILERHSIMSMNDLYLATKIKKKAINLAFELDVDQDYMIVLRRLVASYIVKPRKLADFIELSDEVVLRFKELGIKDSIALHHYLTERSEREVEIELDLELELITTLKSLLATMQLRYVSPAFATVMVRSGYTTIKAVSETTAQKLHHDIKTTNESHKIYKGNIGDSDAQFLIDDAKTFLKYL